jgi:hypothetical protein
MTDENKEMPMNCGTKETTAWHLWEHEVTTAALKAGAELEGIRAMKKRIHAAYIAGEPIWMMVGELIDQCKDYAMHKAVSEHPEIERQFLRSCRKD